MSTLANKYSSLIAMLLPGQKSNQSIIIGSIAILVLLFLIIFGLTPLLQSFGIESMTLSSMYISRMLFWLTLVIVWFYTYKIEKQKLLLWEEKKYPIGFYIVSIILIFLILFVGVIGIQLVCKLLGIKGTSMVLSKMIQLLKGQYVLLVFTALTAGIVEELIFRGYLQPRLTKIFKNPHVAIFVSCSFFALLHYKYGTFINVIGPFFIGLVFAYFYWKYRNIKIVILCHFLWDLLLLIMAVLKNH